MLSASRYVLNGCPRTCAFCHEPLQVEAHRRGDQYFCNDKCADAHSEPVQAGSHPLRKNGTPRLTVVRG